MVERGPEKAGVGGPIPSLGTISEGHRNGLNCLRQSPVFASKSPVKMNFPVEFLTNTVAEIGALRLAG